MRPSVVHPWEPRRRRNPVLALYRWRYELALVGVVAALVYLGHAVHWAAPLALVFAVIVVLVTWAPARRAVADRCRSVVVQHRLRSAFRQLWLTTWEGRAPAILWTAPCPEGLRVHLFCPAGIAAGNFTADVRKTLAAACDAREVRVEPNPQHTALVALVVVTRDPPGERDVRDET
jgi:hypothetical protein